MLTLLIPLVMCWTYACGPAASTSQSDASQPAAPAPQVEAPPVAPPPPTDPSQPQIAPEVDALLDRLEASANDLKSFSADVRYEKQDALLGRKELRAGDVVYRVDDETKSKGIAIRFETTIIDSVRRTDQRYYIFSGRWLVEVDPQNKQFIKREIVAPGETLDPLKLGEGPFPLPIGQPKSQVLARFDVTAAELPDDEALLKNLENVHGLLLVPKVGVREAAEYSKIELFYDRDLLLPVGIITEEVNGERKVIRLLNPKRNETLTDEQQSRLNIDEPDPREWRIDVRPLGNSQ